MAGRLEGKVAFVTGAARGQGRAHAVRLASEGADIIAVDLAGEIPLVPYDSSSMADLEQTVRLVEAEDRRIVFRQGDTRDLGGMKAILDEGVAELGRLDIVVANAGICIPATWDETTPEIFQTTMDINVTGVWHTFNHYRCAKERRAAESFRPLIRPMTVPSSQLRAASATSAITQ